jgi:hypothetical protein
VDRDVIREFFLRGNPNPKRGGCPDHATLKGIAENTLPPNDPARLHLASCSPCFSEFRKLRAHYEKQKVASRHRRQRLYAIFAVAAGLLIAAALRFSGKPSLRSSSREEFALSERTVNLWDKGAFRGEEQGDVNITLPQSRMQLHVILPRLSEPGRYTIGLAHEKSGKNLVEAVAGAVASGPQEKVTVTLDLHSIQPGIYFLTTTREDEEASYYYPVVIA